MGAINTRRAHYQREGSKLTQFAEWSCNQEAERRPGIEHVHGDGHN